MIIILLLAGFYLGLLLGAFLTRKLYKDTIVGYRKDVDYWFDSYMEILKWYHEMKDMYFKEALKNVGK